MNTEESLSWLEKNNLMTIAKNNFVHFKKVLSDCLNAGKEKVLVIGDEGYSDRRISALMAAGYYYAAKKLGLDIEMVLGKAKPKTEKADYAVVDALKSLKKGSVIALCFSDGIGNLKELGKGYRKFILINEHRFVSSMSVGSIPTRCYHYVIDAINVDYAKLKERGKMIKRIFDDGDEIHIKTEIGTDLCIGIRGKEAMVNDGDYSEPGYGGNLPCGEVYLAPRSNKVSGKAVIDGSSKTIFGVVKPKVPVIIEIEKGKIHGIKGAIEAELLKKSINWAYENSKYPLNAKMIGEFGVGINPNAKLIGATIVDEKAYNTAHIAIGSNYWFGGNIYSAIHLDQIFRNPKIYVDGKELRIKP